MTLKAVFTLPSRPRQTLTDITPQVYAGNGMDAYPVTECRGSRGLILDLKGLWHSEMLKGKTWCLPGSTGGSNDEEWQNGRRRGYGEKRVSVVLGRVGDGVRCPSSMLWRTPGSPSIRDMGRQGEKEIVYPSALIRRLYSRLSILSPPAPGRFLTMMLGLPGMCFVQTGAKGRASRSMPPPALEPIIRVSVLPL